MLNSALKRKLCALKRKDECGLRKFCLLVLAEIIGLVTLVGI